MTGADVGDFGELHGLWAVWARKWEPVGTKEEEAALQHMWRAVEYEKRDFILRNSSR